VSDGEVMYCPTCDVGRYVRETKHYPSTRDPRYRSTHYRLSCGHTIIQEPTGPWRPRPVKWA